MKAQASTSVSATGARPATAPMGGMQFATVQTTLKKLCSTPLRQGGMP
jgi:hypothetical protein